MEDMRLGAYRLPWPSGDGNEVSTSKLAELGVRGEDNGEARAPGARLRRFKPLEPKRSSEDMVEGKLRTNLHNLHKQ